MQYDLFISYSRKDNTLGRVTDLKTQIEADYRAFAREALVCFFDLKDIEGMDDWRHRILGGLRESNLLLLVLSPSYIASPYCEWEIVEFLKYEHSRAVGGQGVAPVYFVEVPGLDTPDFERKAAEWVLQVRRRNHFDLRSWNDEGMAALKRRDVRTRLDDLERSLQSRISKLCRFAAAPSNLRAYNPFFVGRESEMQRLHESAGLGRFGVLTAIQGMGGLGKTALAIQYAYAYADFYPGGRWLVGCAGETNLGSVLRRLDVDLGIALNEEEKRDDDRAARRILAELEARSNLGAQTRSGEKNPPQPCALLILDNVDVPDLLQPPQSDLFTGKRWLHVLATTRLGADDLGQDAERQTLLTVDELPIEDAVRLIESHQPHGSFASENERAAATDIARLLGGFTLAVEVVAVYLDERKGLITCAALLERLRRESLAGFENMAMATKRAINYRQKLIGATLGPTLDLLSPEESIILTYAALLPPDTVPLPWLRGLLSNDHPTFGKDAEPGYDDPWITLINHLIGLRLFQVVEIDPDTRFPRLVRMHRLVGELVTKQDQSCIAKISEMLFCMGKFIFMRANDLSKNHQGYLSLWEIDCLFRTTLLSVLTGRFLAQRTAISCCSALRDAGRYAHAIELARATIDARSHGGSDPAVSSVWLHNMAGVCALHLGDSALAETYFRQAHALLGPTIVDGGDQLDTLTNLGCLLRETFRPKDSFGPCREAMALAERLYNHNAPEVGVCCVNLGLVLQDLCRLNEAILLFERALEIDRGRPELILSTCQDMGTLAEALRCASRDSEAEAMAREAVQLAAKHGYGNHTIAAGLNTTLAWTIEDQGDFEEARIYLQSALELTTNCFGDSTPLLAACFNNLGLNSLYSGYHSRALQELERALEIEGQRSNPNAQKLALRELNLSVAFLMANDLAEARVHLMSGWKYRGRTNTKDLLAARLLLVRLAAALLSGESADLFVGQIASLLEEDCLPAAGVNIRWRLENLLLSLIASLPTEYSVYWYRAYNSIKTKMDPGGKQDQRTADGIPARDLKERWPGG